MYYFIMTELFSTPKKRIDVVKRLIHECEERSSMIKLNKYKHELSMLMLNHIEPYAAVCESCGSIKYTTECFCEVN